MEEINKLVDERMSGDTEFQVSIKDLSDEEKNPLIESKRKELTDLELNGLREKALDAEKHKKAYEDQKIRNEKAEKALKEKESEKKEGFSTKDFFALTKANVPEEDIDDVADYAKFKGISVQEALKSSVVKATLAEKAETRRVANAAQTRSTRSQNTAPDGNSVIEDIKSKGEDKVPESGSQEAEALFWARRGRKPM